MEVWQTTPEGVGILFFILFILLTDVHHPYVTMIPVHNNDSKHISNDNNDNNDECLVVNRKKIRFEIFCN